MPSAHPLDEGAALQLLNSLTVFGEYLRALQAANRYVGGMYWKRQGTYEYLVQTAPDNSQKRLGARSPETEATHAAFLAGKRAAESRRDSLAKAMDEARRLNRAQRVGQAPAVLVALLQRLYAAGLSSHLTLMGAPALYAYEAAAGVRIDADGLGDARQRVTFITHSAKAEDQAILQILQRIDSSFEWRQDAFVNGRGFAVVLCRTEALTRAPRFWHPVVARNGSMAMMYTLAPSSFVSATKWRDGQQAAVVQQILAGAPLDLDSLARPPDGSQ